MSCINLKRNSRVWISTVDTGWDDTNTWELPITQDYSMSQSTSSSDITLNESGDSPSRGSKRFNDALEPAEWSLSVYTTPFMDSANVSLVDAILWHSLVSKEAPDFTNVSTSANAYGDPTSFKVDFLSSQTNSLSKFNIYAQVDGEFMLIKQSTVNQLEVNFDIEGLAMASWSGNGTELELLDTAPSFIAGGQFKAKPTLTSSNYITNKLSESIIIGDLGPGVETYRIPMTGGSITISNNITYITPETLGSVDVPVAAFTGALEVSGSLEAYLRTFPAAKGTRDLLKNMLDAKGLVSNSFDIEIGLGSVSGTRMVISLPTAQLTIPSTSLDDVVQTTIEFKGIPSGDCLDSGDEVNFEFFVV